MGNTALIQIPTNANLDQLSIKFIVCKISRHAQKHRGFDDFDAFHTLLTMPKNSLKRRDFPAPQTSRQRADYRSDSNDHRQANPRPSTNYRASNSTPSIKLSFQALAIVEAVHRHIEVFACAGSGKTTVLCHCVMHLLSLGVSLASIMIVSFSNTAASEIRVRLSHLVQQPRLDDPGFTADCDASSGGTGANRESDSAVSFTKRSVATCHAFANRLVRVSRSHLKKDQPKLVLLKPADVPLFMARSIQRARAQLKAKRSLSKIERNKLRAVLASWLSPAAASDDASPTTPSMPSPKIKLNTIAALFDFATASDQSFEQVVSNPRFSQFDQTSAISALTLVRAQYRKLKTERNRIDYADMVTLATAAVINVHAQGGKAVGKALQITHLIVDEYQDSSAAQVQFIAGLAQTVPDLNVLVLGDEHQSIYQFAGSFHTPLSQLLPDVAVMPLDRSYRLRQTVADAAVAILRADSCKSVGQAVAGVSAGTTAQCEITRINGRRGGTKPVLVISASLSTQLVAAVADIQARLAQDVKPREMAVLAPTKAVLREIESELLCKGIAVARRGLPADLTNVMHTLRLVRFVERAAAGHTLPTVAELKAALTGVKAADELWLAALKSLRKVVNPTLEGRYMRCSSIYLVLRGGVRADDKRRDDVCRWIPVCRFHADARSMRDAVRQMDGAGGVITSTINQAKGGEWEHVFIVGVADGQMPNYLARNDERTLIEGRNLLHVAITRPRETARLYFAPVNHARSHQRFAKLSRYLDRPEVLSRFDLEHR